MMYKLLLVLLLIPICTLGYAQTGTLVAEVEAEDGTLSGNVSQARSVVGFSGTGYVTNFKSDGDMVSVKVEVPSKAFYSIYIRYHSESYKEQYLSLNGESSSSVRFESSGSSFSLANAGKYLFDEGENTITINSSWGWMDIDKFLIYTTELNSYDNVTTELIDAKADGATRALYNYLLFHYGNRIITGQTNEYTDWVKSLTGKSPVLKAWDFTGYTKGYPYIWANGAHTFGKNTSDKSTENAIAWYEETGRKGIVAFHWHWHSPSGGQAGKNNFYTENTTFDIRQAVIEGTEEYKLIIRDIDEIAIELKKLQTAGVPVLWRPLHEAGGGWFWWGAQGAAPCKKLWDILYDRICNYHQIHNLIWVWSAPEADWYLGNDKLDIFGYDSYPGVYNYGTQKNTFDICHDLSNGTKIITMSENGPIPDIDDCLDLDAPWSYFMSWSDLLKAQNSEEHIKEVYDNPRALTLETDTFPRIIYTKEASICGSGSVTLEAKSNFGTVNWYENETGGEPFLSGESYTTPVLNSSKTYYIDCEYNGHSSGMRRVAIKTILADEIGQLNIEGPTNPCQGETSVSYSVNSSVEADVYNWTLSSGLSGKSSSNFILVDIDSGVEDAVLSVSAENVCGTSPVSSIDITPKLLPESVGEIDGPTIICKGTEEAEFKVLQSDDVTSYKWTLPDGTTGSSDSASILVDFKTTFSSGIIYVQGINSCGVGEVSSLAIASKKAPSAPSTIVGTFTVCQSTNEVAYNSSSIANADSYIWTLPEGAEGASSTKSIVVDFGPDAATGKISVQGENECGIGTAKSMTVTVNPTPETPSIILDDNGFLVSNASSGNQWYANDMAIENAIGDTLQPTVNADYFTIVTLKGCQSEASNRILFTNVDQFSHEKITLYPNPLDYGNTQLHIAGSSDFLGESVQLINLNGQIIGVAKISDRTIFLPQILERGVYLLSLENESSTLFSKLIVR